MYICQSVSDTRICYICTRLVLSTYPPLVTWHKLFDQRCCILFSWTTKTMRTFRFSFPFTLSTKANLCVFNLQCMPDRALDFKTWSRHDILNLVPVEHLWYASCKKYFRLDVHFESESVNQISQLQSLLVLNGFCGKTFGKCCQSFCFHTRFSMWWCFFLKRCQGFCFYIGFSLTIWWCWWRKESGRVMMMLTDCWW